MLSLFVGGIVSVGCTGLKRGRGWALTNKRDADFIPLCLSGMIRLEEEVAVDADLVGRLPSPVARPAKVWACIVRGEIHMLYICSKDCDGVSSVGYPSPSCGQSCDQSKGDWERTRAASGSYPTLSQTRLRKAADVVENKLGERGGSITC